jgi:hypothetical protein
MNRPIIITLTISCIVSLLPVRGQSLRACSLWSVASAQTEGGDSGKSWKTLEELSLEEKARIDLSEQTLRHPEIRYLPAESYPFQPPFTAEERGYRMMEFTQRPRWSCVFANVWGSISPQGVLMNLLMPKAHNE